jgi:hypothetical protein
MWIVDVGRAQMPDSGRLAARLALILAAVAAVAVLFLPLGVYVEVEPVVPGEAPPPPPQEIGRTTLLQEEGAWIVLLAAFPVVLAAIPMIGERLRPGSRALRVVAAVALWLFVVLGLASIGWFFAPSAIAMTVAALAWRHRAPQRESL